MEKFIAAATKSFAKIGHRAEHYGLALYSSCEVFELHHLIWFCSIGMLLVGIAGILYETFIVAE